MYMKKASLKNQQGFVKTVLVFIIALVAIEYFNIDVKAIVESDIVQSTIATIKSLFTNYVAPGLESVKEAIPEEVIEESVEQSVLEI